MADQLCTTAQVKARAGITDAADDAVISEIIDQVSDEIQNFTKRKLVAEAATTYVFDTAFGHTLLVPRGIRAVTAMGIAALDQPDTAGAYSAVTLSTILLRPVAAERKPGWPATEIRLTASPLDTRYPFRTAANGATVTGDFGFAVTPPVIVRIAISATLAEYLDRRRGGSAGPEGIELPALLDAAQLATLARFRAPSIGIG